MRLTIDDASDGSQFELDLLGGTPLPGTALLTATPDGMDRRLYRVISVSGSTVEVQREPMSHGVMCVPSPPPTRPPTATPAIAYGNNATVVCGCGTSIMVRSLGKVADGAYRCGCGRYLKGFPDNGRRIEYVHVWEAGDESAQGTYRVFVDPQLHQA